MERSLCHAKLLEEEKGEASGLPHENKEKCEHNDATILQGTLGQEAMCSGKRQVLVQQEPKPGYCVR